MGERAPCVDSMIPKPCHREHHLQAACGRAGRKLEDQLIFGRTKDFYFEISRPGLDVELILLNAEAKMMSYVKIGFDRPDCELCL